MPDGEHDDLAQRAGDGRRGAGRDRARWPTSALLLAALWTLLSGMRWIAPGPRGALPAARRTGTGSSRPRRGSRSPPAFAALLVHTIGYAGYLTDPLTWALLAVGGVLAAEVGAGNGPAQLPAPSARQSAE